MPYFKNLFRGLLSSLLKLSLLLLAFTASLVMVFGTSTPLKQALRSSKIYSSGVDNVIDSTHNNESTGTALSLSQPDLRQAAKTAITPDFLQDASERIIDGSYLWLNGKTAQPEFQIDISAAKQRFVQAVGDKAVNRAKILPQCTVSQSRALATSSFDPLTITCVPAGFNANNLRGALDLQIGKNDGNILKNSVITAENLPRDEKGKTVVQNVTDNVHQAPLIYQWLMPPWVLGGLAVIFGGSVILLFAEKRRGLGSVAVTFLSVGIFLLIGCAITTIIFSIASKPSGPFRQFSEALQQPIFAATHALNNAFVHRLLLFGIGYLTVGGGTLLALRFTRPDFVAETSSTNTETPKPNPTSPNTVETNNGSASPEQ